MSLENIRELRFLVESYYDLQKLRIETGNRLYQLIGKDKLQDARFVGLTSTFKRLKELEKGVSSLIKSEVKTLPIWNMWLKDVKGIGHILTAGLYSWICGQKHTAKCIKKREKYFAKKAKGAKKRKTRFECKCPIIAIGRFPYVSSLWKYCGLDVVGGKAPKRTKGKKITWNPRMKTLCWKIGESFVKTRDFYRTQYDNFRDAEDTKHPDLSKLHRYNRAKRKTVKLFLSHLFSNWYGLEGLEAPKPYGLAVLDHKHEIKPIII